MPQRVQNLVIRTYAQAHGKQFLLSATEYGMEACWMMLRAVIDELPALEGVIFYSLDQLPSERGARREILSRFVDTGVELHFALEELAVKDAQSMRVVEDLFLTRALARSSIEVPLE